MGQEVPGSSKDSKIAPLYVSFATLCTVHTLVENMQLYNSINQLEDCLVVNVCSIARMLQMVIQEARLRAMMMLELITEQSLALQWMLKYIKLFKTSNKVSLRFYNCCWPVLPASANIFRTATWAPSTSAQSALWGFVLGSGSCFIWIGCVNSSGRPAVDSEHKMEVVLAKNSSPSWDERICGSGNGQEIWQTSIMSISFT